MVPCGSRPKESNTSYRNPVGQPPMRQQNSILFSPVRLGSLELEERSMGARDGSLAGDRGRPSSPTRSLPGTSVLHRASREQSSSRPPVSATFRADLCYRIGHDRFIPGLRELVDTVHRASSGRTRLLIQVIDFLTIRRRPDPEKFLRRFLVITDRHRARLGCDDDDDVREALVALGDEELDRDTRAA